MSAVFEDFVRNFFRLEQQEFRIAGRALDWDLDQYLSEPVEDMRPRDYNATHLVKAVKGLERIRRSSVHI